MTNTPVQNKILAGRTSLLWDDNLCFFGGLCMQLEVIDATDDPRIDTMATDGKRLYYHEPFVMGMTADELLFVLAHEVLHNANEHHIRRQGRKPGRWNKAADYAINGDLVQAKVGKMPDGGLIDPRFTGLGAEEIYRILDDENNGDDSDEQQDPGGCGGVLDACDPSDKAGMAEALAEIQTQVRQAAAVAAAKGNGVGNLPAGLRRLIAKLTRPKVDWRTLLRRFIDESMVRDFSWAKPNRRFLPLGHVLPSAISAGVSHLVLAVDTSGSINDKILTAFASEIDAAYGEGMIDKITVIYADSKVAGVDVFENGDELFIAPRGGGGTAFSDTFNWIAENADDAALVVYFTDLEVFDFGKEPRCQTVWAIYGRSDKFDALAETAPFGEAVSLAAA